jgi:uncharacterized protein YndB with AHSA1/START domain
MVFEPRVGGNIYDRGVDGSESRWARVLAYEPSIRLVFSWDIDGRRQIETDFEKTSEVEVRFTPETPRSHPSRTGAPPPRAPPRWLGEPPRCRRLPNGWQGGLQAFANRLGA